MKNKLLYFYSIILILSLLSFLPVNAKPGSNPGGNISFEPNVIPFLDISLLKNMSFHFEWYHHFFNLNLYVNSETSLESFNSISNCVITPIMKENPSKIEFGYNIENIPEEVSKNVEFLVWKIEDANFNVTSCVTHEVIEVLEQDYTITRFHLPDNLVLSYEDLWLYDFTVEHPSKTETIVKGVKGKTAWNLDPITYSSPIMTFTGGSEGSEIDNFHWEFWNASNTNAWNVSWNNRNNDTQFQFDCELYIGNATHAGWVKDDTVEVVFSNFSTAHWQYCYRIVNGGMTLGQLKNATYKSTEGGVTIIDNEDTYYRYGIFADAGAKTNFYGSTLTGSFIIQRNIFRSGNIYNSRFEGRGGGISVQPISMDVYNTYLIGGYEGWRNPSGCTFDTLWSFNAKTTNLYLIVASGTFTFSNFYQRDGGNIYADARTGTTVYLINVDIDAWNFTWAFAGFGIVYRQYTFDLTVTYPNGTGIENANVTIKHYGQGETQDFTELTDANGQISQKTLSMGFYNQTGGNTIYNYNPYNIEITNVTDYQDYNGNFTLSEQTGWTITLTPEPYNWFGASIMIALFACLVLVITLTTTK